MSIAGKLLDRLGSAIQTTTEKADIFITKPELANWIEMYNMKMIARGRADNVVELFKEDGNVDEKKWEEAFEVYNAIYLYNLEKAAAYRNTKTGISLIDPIDYGYRISTRVRKADRAGIHGRGEDVDDPTSTAAENILTTVGKKEVPGVALD